MNRILPTIFPISEDLTLLHTCFKIVTIRAIPIGEAKKKHFHNIYFFYKVRICGEDFPKPDSYFKYERLIGYTRGDLIAKLSNEFRKSTDNVNFLRKIETEIQYGVTITMYFKKPLF